MYSGCTVAFCEVTSSVYKTSVRTSSNGTR